MTSALNFLWHNIGRIIIGLILLVVAYFAYQRLFGEPFNPMAGFGGPMPVTVAKVAVSDYQPTYEFTGRLSAVNEAIIRPQVAGTVQAIHFKEGQMVKAGDKLFSINPATYQTALAQAEAALTQAKAAFERGEKLRGQDAISPAEMEARSSAYRAAQAAATQARQQLNDALVRAPISGKVGRPEVTVGNPVSAGNGHRC
ncbi:MAG: efflux RND transporter periplasmic adaptor subunit [Proteobacteria bacterium]|nr:efflux RND transporter periplasmic adaptor subunit [Pseudomonadota bacterium]